MQTLHFSTTIRAPREKVWETMLGDQSYRQWTSVFAPGSYYEGDWNRGSKILFLAPGEGGKVGGMVSRIAESRPPEHISPSTSASSRMAARTRRATPSRAGRGPGRATP